MATYEEVEFNGEPARRYADGTLRNTKGHWLAKPTGAAPSITDPAIAAEYGRRGVEARRDRRRAALESGMAKATPYGDVDITYSAIGQNIATLAIEKDDQVAVQAAKIALTIAGLGDRDSVPQVAVQVNIDGQVFEGLQRGEW